MDSAKKNRRSRGGALVFYPPELTPAVSAPYVGASRGTLEVPCCKPPEKAAQQVARLKEPPLFPAGRTPLADDL